MKSWKLVFALFLLFVFVFFIVIVGDNEPIIWIKENMGKFCLYVFFTIIILCTVYTQRRRRMYIPSSNQIRLPYERSYLEKFNLNGRIVEIFSIEDFGEDFLIAQDATADVACVANKITSEKDKYPGVKTVQDSRKKRDMELDIMLSNLKDEQITDSAIK